MTWWQSYAVVVGDVERNGGKLHVGAPVVLKETDYKNIVKEQKATKRNSKQSGIEEIQLRRYGERRCVHRNIFE